MSERQVGDRHVGEKHREHGADGVQRDGQKQAVSDLLPCPLCGGEAEYVATSQIRDPWYTWGLDAIGCTVQCAECGCTIPSGMSMKVVADAWNRRAI